MKILGIETTCDETGVGIVEDGRLILANVVGSSAKLHEKYGGIVPEVAAREQARVFVPVLKEALSKANVLITDIDSVAVAHGPGLVGPLLVGVEAAKVISFFLNIPLIPVNHLVGHIYANWVNRAVVPRFPLVALLVSGGHTELVFMKNFRTYRLLGSTRDDAAGEVFDKVARTLRLGYPGGPQIERRASEYRRGETQVEFPRPMIAEGSYDFSFAGIKTAVARYAERTNLTPEAVDEIAFSFQNSMVDVLVTKTISAALKHGVKNVVVGGGVAANNLLRRNLKKICAAHNIDVFFPENGLSIDNGVMVAAAAFYDDAPIDPLKLQAEPGLRIS
jgi:N6-L-threonylcarbamoyladenine synthase